MHLSVSTAKKSTTTEHIHLESRQCMNGDDDDVRLQGDLPNWRSKYLNEKIMLIMNETYDERARTTTGNFHK